MNSIKMTVEQIRGVVLASEKKGIRYYLNGALFDFAMGRVVSTDGHVCLAVNVKAECDDVKNACVIIPRDALEVTAKGGKITDTVTITYSDDGLKLARSNGMTGEWNPIDATFPQWERLIPRQVSGEVSQFNPQLLDRISKALRMAANPPKSRYPTIGHNGNAASTMFFHGFSDRAIAVVMPCKCEGSSDAEVLDFFNRGDVEEKAA